MLTYLSLLDCKQWIVTDTQSVYYDVHLFYHYHVIGLVRQVYQRPSLPQLLFFSLVTLLICSVCIHHPK